MPNGWNQWWRCFFFLFYPICAFAQIVLFTRWNFIMVDIRTKLILQFCLHREHRVPVFFNEIHMSFWLYTREDDENSIGLPKQLYLNFVHVIQANKLDSNSLSSMHCSKIKKTRITHTTQPDQLLRLTHFLLYDNWTVSFFFLCKFNFSDFSCARHWIYMTFILLSSWFSPLWTFLFFSLAHFRTINSMSFSANHRKNSCCSTVHEGEEKEYRTQQQYTAGKLKRFAVNHNKLEQIHVLSPHLISINVQWVRFYGNAIFQISRITTEKINFFLLDGAQ